MCNHPELLERREVKSPFTVIPEPYLLPKLLYRENLFNQLLPSRNHLINNHLSIYHSDYVYHSLKHNNKGKVTDENVRVSCQNNLKYLELLSCCCFELNLISLFINFLLINLIYLSILINLCSFSVYLKFKNVFAKLKIAEIFKIFLQIIENENSDSYILMFIIFLIQHIIF